MAGSGDEVPTSQGRAARSLSAVNSSPFWKRIREEADLPVTVPPWFLLLRAVSKTGVYGVSVAWMAFLPTSEATDIVLWTVIGVLWLTIVVGSALDFRHRRRTEKARMLRASDVAMILAPLPIFLGSPIIVGALLVAGYGMQLRRISGGEVFLFALVGSFGALLLGTIALYGAESADSKSPISSPTDAAVFAAATLMRLNSLKAGNPVTEEGQVVVTVLQVVSAIFLGALYGGLLTMVVKDSGKRKTNDTTEARLAYVIKQQQEILRRLDALAPKPAADPPEPASATGDAPPAPGSLT